MKVTSVTIKKTESIDNKLKGYATIILDDCLAIHDIKIVQGKEKLFLSMPSKKAIINDETKYYDYVHPTVQELRKEKEDEILKEFN